MEDMSLLNVSVLRTLLVPVVLQLTWQVTVADEKVSGGLVFTLLEFIVIDNILRYFYTFVLIIICFDCTKIRFRLQHFLLNFEWNLLLVSSVCIPIKKNKFVCSLLRIPTLKKKN
jgi:hypothetical protein